VTFSLVALIPFAALTAVCVSFVHAGPAPVSVQVVATTDGIAAAALLWLPADARLGGDAARPIAVRNGRSTYVDGSAAIAFSIGCDQEELSHLIVEHFAATNWRQRRTRREAMDGLDEVVRVERLMRGGASVALHCRQSGMPLQTALDAISKARGVTVPETQGQRDWLQRVEPRLSHADR
jgi:hypothetical protein